MEHFLKKIEEEIQVHLDNLKLELSDIEYIRDGGYNYLKIYIEKIDGATTLEDCENFSKKIDEVADKFIDEKFFLEVSTPGIERKLKKDKDFIRFAGKKIKVYTKSNVEGKKVFEGILEKFQDDTVFIFDIKLEKIVEIPMDKLKKSNLIYEMPSGTLNSEEE